MNLGTDMNRSTAVILLIVILVTLYIGLTFPFRTTRDDHTIHITASFYPIAFFIQRIAGDTAVINTITPAGIEPHDYEPTAQDIARMQESSLLILNGGGFEPWARNIEDIIDTSHTSVIYLSDTLADQSIQEDTEKVQDPHVWLSPKRAQKQVIILTEALIKKDPKNASTYEKNAHKLTQQLAQLDEHYSETLKTCKKRIIVTSHAAFGYLARDYNVTQISIQGIAPEAEPSAQKLAGIAEFARKNDARYIFFESLVSPRFSETIAKEVGAQALVLDPLEGISDNDKRAGKNYITIMENNLANLRIALSCQ